MEIFTWNCTDLQPSDLPEKARRFIAMMDIDVSDLTLMVLTPSPDGKFIKSFNKPYCRWAATVEYNTIYFFGGYPKVGTAIHELTHIYFRQSRFFKDIEYDFKAMGEKFIAQHGQNALTYYAQINILENNWAEVICEIVAVYGRRGQFNKIKKLLNQYTCQTKKEESQHG